MFQGTNGIWFWQIILYWYIFWQLCKDLARWYLDIFIYILLLNFKFLQETNCNIWNFFKYPKCSINLILCFICQELLCYSIPVTDEPFCWFPHILFLLSIINILQQNVVCLNKEFLIKEILLWLYNLRDTKIFPQIWW